MKKTILLSVLAVALLAFAACDADPIMPPGVDGLTSLSEFSASYEDGVLYYDAVLDKPTPCHVVEVEETISDVLRVDFVTSVNETDEICAQVITPEEISREVEMEMPMTILVYIDGVLASEESVEEANGIPSNGDIVDIGEEGFSVWYDNGFLRYSAVIEKPTPCHELDVEEMLLESYPVQVSVNVDIYNPDPEQVCVQVVDVVELEGTIEIDHVPASFSLSIDGEEVYRTSEIEEV